MDLVVFEMVNFCRVVCFILNVCIDVFRDLLWCKIKGGELILIKDIVVNKVKLEKYKKMFDVERKKLFLIGSVFVRYELFDILFMYFIVRNVCLEKIEIDLNEKWGKRFVVGDFSFFVVIEIIRLFRNDYYVYVIEVKIFEYVF